MREYKAKMTERRGRLQRRLKRFGCCHQDCKTEDGFTLVEVLIVVLIIAIAAMVAVPMLGSTDSMQVRSAANMIAADLEYAKSMAISRQENYSVVFPAENYYEVHDQNGIVKNPVTKFDYKVDFSGDSRLNKVVIESADFDSDPSNTITFDSLGGPHRGSGASPPFLSVEGAISIKAGDITMTIKIAPVTGFISIE